MPPREPQPNSELDRDQHLSNQTGVPAGNQARPIVTAEERRTGDDRRRRSRTDRRRPDRHAE